MSREPVPLVVDDLSAFTKSLSHSLKTASEPPSHLTLMNMLARSAGFRNVQHLKAAHAAGKRLADTPEPKTIDHQLIERTLEQFDAQGRLSQWPAKRSIQDLSLWAFWARLPRGETLSERAVNDLLNEVHLFGDPAILRRSMVTLNMVTRDQACSQYQRIEQRPPANARALIGHLEQRRRQSESANVETAT